MFRSADSSTCQSRHLHLSITRLTWSYISLACFTLPRARYQAEPGGNTREQSGKIPRTRLPRLPRPPRPSLQTAERQREGQTRGIQTDRQMEDRQQTDRWSFYVLPPCCSPSVCCSTLLHFHLLPLSEGGVVLLVHAGNRCCHGNLLHHRIVEETGNSWS